MKILILLLTIVIFSCSDTDVNKEESRINLLNKFKNPLIEAKLRAYWLWINGNVTREAITRDFEQMKAKGFGGAVLCDMDRSYIRENKQVPHGPDFMSTEWRNLFKHALKEADRLGLEISLNITSGWAIGGPMIDIEDAPKILTWTKKNIEGPGQIKIKLPLPDLNRFNVYPHRAHEKPAKIIMDSVYHDIFIIAYPKRKTGKIINWEIKGLHRPLHHSAPETDILFDNKDINLATNVIKQDEIIDLSENITPDGQLECNLPEGKWEILRIGYTTYPKGVKWASSEGWTGFPLDVFDDEIFEEYWNQVMDTLIMDAGELAGKSLKYLHSDSWELEPINWTPDYQEEFKKRHGYDILPFVPVLVGNVVDNIQISNRFLHDFRKTFGDLVIDNYYRIFKEQANYNNLKIHPESGGPHSVPIDAQECLGFNDIPMSEFWAKSWTHRVTDEQRFFVKQPASAAHTYGKKTVMAEGFTTIGPHWQETIRDNLKPTFDKALCEGLNQLVWHVFPCSPKEMGIPGQAIFAGTHINPNVTWWSRSEAFLSYINRCQAMLQHGLFTADVAYYYGDHVPNFSQLKSSDPCNILPGYDYDVVTEELILERMDVSDNKLVLPDGMSYKILVLPDYPGFSLPVLKKIKELIQKGAIVAGPKPAYMNGLKGYPESDREFKVLVKELWGDSYSNGSYLEKKIGEGILYSGIEIRELLEKMDIQQDFSFVGRQSEAEIDYIHRSDESLDIYFISNQKNINEELLCEFRISGKQPEFWDPVTGKIRNATDWSVQNGRTRIPLKLSPYGSVFIVFSKAADPPATDSAPPNFPVYEILKTLNGTWEVNFDKEWGGPGSIIFDKLESWTERTEPDIRYYSGTATYKKTFDIDIDDQNMKDVAYFIDLGDVRELAEVRLNGKKPNILWSYPFRTDITDAIKSGENHLEIDVVNFWPNRIIGDQYLPEDQRYTSTNINVFKKDSPLIPSGLLGPVSIMKLLSIERSM
jgi:hypothetical protein